MNDMFKKIKPILPFMFALAAGAIMPLAFAPYYIGVSCIISCVIFLWCLAQHSPKKAFLIGWCYGIGLFGAGVYWVYVSIHDYGNASPALASFITALFVITIALYPAVMAALLNRYVPRHGMVRCVLIFPALWVACELLRGWAFTGFPWLFAGYSQMQTHLRAFAPIGGVFAVSWSTVLISALIYQIIYYFYQASPNKKLRNSLFLLLFAVWAVAFGLGRFTFTTPTDKTLNVALVQGNIPQLMRWDPKYIASIINVYRTLTFSTAQEGNLVVWPEGAIPIPLPDSQAFFKDLADLMQVRSIGLFTGVPIQATHQEYYNSLIGIGLATGVYHKEHLVPFGEYVPFETWLRGLIDFFNLPMSNFVPGSLVQQPLFAQGFSFAPAICYEIAYPLFVQNMVKNADFILTVSNDTWFGTSIGPAQHLQIAQFRALETGKYVLRATNTGFTAIINPEGSIENIAPQFEATVLTGTITQMHGQTPWVRFGIWPLLTALAISLGGGFLLNARTKK